MAKKPLFVVILLILTFTFALLSRSGAKTITPVANNSTPLSTPVSEHVSTPLPQPIPETADQVALRILKSYKPGLRPNVKVTTGNMKVSQGLLDAFKFAVQNYPTKLFEPQGISEEKYEVKGGNLEKGWAGVSLGPVGIPANIQKEINTGKLTEWAPPLYAALAYQMQDGTWVAVLEATDGYKDLVRVTPDWFISPNSKELMLKF